jgi:uncharacterized protein (TIGR02271 family)
MNATTGMTDAYEWRGREVIGSDGEKIGTVDEVYLDTASDKPEWLAINMGLFGLKSSFAPIQGARPEGEAVRLAYTKEQVKGAPGVEPDQELNDSEERSLWSHYGLDYASAGTGLGGSGDRDETVGRDVSGPETDSAMTRSEEELRVGTREREQGRARLRKYVVTEEVTKTVPVKKERAVLEREPITEGNVEAATDGPAISDEEHEVTLSEEEVVVEKKAVPKERVRLDKETETREERVSEEVRKEQIEAEGDIRR